LRSLALLIDDAAGQDVNVFEKGDEKILKYRPLAREISICYGQPVEIVPIVFGHTGVVSCRQLTYLKKLPCFSDSLFQQLQQTTLLGTISILRDLNFHYGVT